MRAYLAALAGFGLLGLAVVSCSSSDPAPKDGGPGSIGGTSGFGGSGGPSSSSGKTSSGSSSNDNVDVTTETMDLNGTPRTYILAKPKGFDPAKAYPLVMSFHGNPGDAKSQAAGLPYDKVSKKDAVIVYPQAAAPDDALFDWDQTTPAADNLDIQFIQKLTDEINGKIKIDKTKVFGWGFSGGSFFINTFTCAVKDVFAAIAINAGGAVDGSMAGYQNRDDGCYICPAGPVPTLVTHGGKDDTVGPESGTFAARCARETNGCSDDSSTFDPLPCKKYHDCMAGQPVELCQIDDLGHALWDQALNVSWTFFISPK